MWTGSPGPPRSSSGRSCRARFGDDEDGIEGRSQDFQRLRRELLDAERAAVLELRRTGLIGNDVWLSVSRDLDLEDERLDS